MYRTDTQFPLPPEQIVRLVDAGSGLDGVVVLHSTRLGPAAGGCRLWTYSDVEQATEDAMRLAEGMSYKNAMAGLPLGGGKAVLRRPSDTFDHKRLFKAFGSAVAELQGRYVTAEDVGTSVEDMSHVAESTWHVAGLPAATGLPGGDPSPWTARGVFQAMRVAVEQRLDRGLADVTVAVQGVGHVGFALCELLHSAGARLILAEPRPEVAAHAAMRFGAELRTLDSIVEAQADVFAPCALGGAINERAVTRIKAKVVCGAANNQLSTPAMGERLADKGILYAPDYIVNAGGIINVAGEYLRWSPREVADRVNATGERLALVLAAARADGVTPDQAADARARALIAERESLADPVP